MGEANETVRPKFRLEYLTYALPSLYPPPSSAGSEDDDEIEPGSDAGDVRAPTSRSLDVEKKRGKNKRGGGFAYPVPLKQLPRSLRVQNETRTKSKYAPYRLADLTVGSWVKFARRLGDKERTKLRARFTRFMYMGGEEA